MEDELSEPAPDEKDKAQRAMFLLGLLKESRKKKKDMVEERKKTPREE